MARSVTMYCPGTGWSGRITGSAPGDGADWAPAALAVAMSATALTATSATNDFRGFLMLTAPSDFYPPHSRGRLGELYSGAGHDAA